MCLVILRYRAAAQVKFGDIVNTADFNPGGMMKRTLWIFLLTCLLSGCGFNTLQTTGEPTQALSWLLIAFENFPQLQHDQHLRENPAPQEGTEGRVT